MNTNGINALDLEASALAAVNEPAERGRGIGAGEDVLVHEKTPDEILKLPVLTETSNLQEEDTIVVEHVMNLLEETVEVADTNVLGHLQTGNLAVATLRDGDITVVHAQNLALVLGNASIAQSLVAPSSLVAAESDTGGLGAIVDTGEAGKSAPAAADVEKLLVLLELNLFANNSKLVVLELLQRLLLVDVGNDTRSVDHTRAEEPAVKVITAVVVVTDLLLI